MVPKAIVGEHDELMSDRQIHGFFAYGPRIAVIRPMGGLPSMISRGWNPLGCQIHADEEFRIHDVERGLLAPPVSKRRRPGIG